MPHRPIEPDLLTDFFRRAGSQTPHSATLYIFGGAAIQLLGGARATWRDAHSSNPILVLSLPPARRPVRLNVMPLP